MNGVYRVHLRIMEQRGPMRYASLPPALVRGVIPVRTLVSGGVRITDNKASNNVHIGLTQQVYKLEFAELAAKPPMPLPLGEVPPKGAERALSVTA